MNLSTRFLKFAEVFRMTQLRWPIAGGDPVASECAIQKGLAGDPEHHVKGLAAIEPRGCKQHGNFPKGDLDPRGCTSTDRPLQDFVKG